MRGSLSDKLFIFVAPSIGLAVAVVMWATLGYLAPSHSHIMRGLFAILGFIATLAIVGFSRQEAQLQNLRTKIDALSSALSYKLQSDFERSELFPSQPQELTLDQMPTVWLNLLMQFKEGFAATNFIAADDIFSKEYASRGREVLSWFSVKWKAQASG